jgi:4-nitrophenyl phosphatase
MAQRGPAGATVYVIGEDGLHEASRERGLTLVDERAQQAEFVVVGWDRTLTWDKLRQACLLIRRGAHFVGTNPDRTYPTPEGLVPGNGATLAALEAATDVAPVIVGKPEPLLYRVALERLGTLPAETAALGDRLETDILGGVRAGTRTILVLSGVTTPAQLAASELQPDEVYTDIGAIARAWA